MKFHKGTKDKGLYIGSACFISCVLCVYLSILEYKAAYWISFLSIECPLKGNQFGRRVLPRFREVKEHCLQEKRLP